VEAARNHAISGQIRQAGRLQTAGGCKNFGYNTFTMLRFLTAGESHGPALVAILEGLPSGLTLDQDRLTSELRRRQQGYGRGRRMAIESDQAEILSGVRHGRTTGAPVALLIRNKDWVHWQATMSAGHVDEGGRERPPVTRPRPGHADLAGALKYGHRDLRDVLERASARETAARVAIGSIARQLLAGFSVEVASHVVAIGSVVLEAGHDVSFERARAVPDESPLRCIDSAVERAMIEEIDRAKAAGDTVGGVFEVIAHQVPPGLGSYSQWDRKLDGRLAQAVMSIPAVKAVGFGMGARAAATWGSGVHDSILPPPTGERSATQIVARGTNHAGGIEGGVSNGQDVRVTGYMKPIATLMKPLPSVDLDTLEPAPAAIERSDVCAVPAAAVVAESVVCLVLAEAFVEKFGGDSMQEMTRNYEAFKQDLWQRFANRP
jgi:chorismate synthase